MGYIQPDGQIEEIWLMLRAGLHHVAVIKTVVPICKSLTVVP